MSRPQLSARPREVRGKHVSRLRSAGVLPGVVYGAGHDSKAIELDAREFETLHKHTGRNVVLDLVVEGDGAAQPVLLQAIQEHPVTRRPLHIDLLVVNLQEERTAETPILIIGHSEAVDKMGGVLLHMRDSVTVRAKPDDLPSGIELDITPLDSFEAVLHVSDLQIPAGVTLVTEASEAIARVQPPRVEEEPIAAEVEEGEEAVEGEAPEAEAASEEAGESGAGEESEES
jgi:large subunit ribosomal protein L25